MEPKEPRKPQPPSGSKTPDEAQGQFFEKKGSSAPTENREIEARERQERAKNGTEKILKEGGTAKEYMRNKKQKYEEIADQLLNAAAPGILEREEVASPDQELDEKKAVEKLTREAKAAREEFQKVLEADYAEAEVILDEIDIAASKPEHVLSEEERRQFLKNHQRLLEVLAKAQKDALETGDPESRKKAESLQVMLNKFYENVGQRLSQPTDSHTSPDMSARSWFEKGAPIEREESLPAKSPAPEESARADAASTAATLMPETSQPSETEPVIQREGTEDKVPGDQAASTASPEPQREEEQKEAWEADVQKAYEAVKAEIFDPAWNGRLGILMRAHERAKRKYEELQGKNLAAMNPKERLKQAQLRKAFGELGSQLEIEYNDQETLAIERALLAWLEDHEAEFPSFKDRTEQGTVNDPALRDVFDNFLAQHKDELMALAPVSDDEVEKFLQEAETLINPSQEEAIEETQAATVSPAPTSSAEQKTTEQAPQESMPEARKETVLPETEKEPQPEPLDAYIMENFWDLCRFDPENQIKTQHIQKFVSRNLGKNFDELSPEEQASITGAFNEKLEEKKKSWDAEVEGIYGVLKTEIFDPAWNGRFGELKRAQGQASQKYYELRNRTEAAGQPQDTMTLREKFKDIDWRLHEALSKEKQKIDKALLLWIKAHEEESPYLKDRPSEGTVFDPAFEVYFLFLRKHFEEFSELPTITDEEAQHFLDEAEKLLQAQPAEAPETTFPEEPEINLGGETVGFEEDEEKTRPLGPQTQRPAPSSFNEPPRGHREFPSPQPLPREPKNFPFPPTPRERRAETPTPFEEPQEKIDRAQQVRKLFEGKSVRYFEGIGNSIAQDMSSAQRELQEIESQMAKAQAGMKEARHPDTQQNYERQYQALAEQRAQIAQSIEKGKHGSLRDSLDLALQDLPELRNDRALRGAIVGKVAERLQQDVEGKAMDASFWSRALTSFKQQLPITLAAVGASFVGRVGTAFLPLESILRNFGVAGTAFAVRAGTLGKMFSERGQRARDQEKIKFETRKKIVSQNPEWLKATLTALVTSELQKTNKLEDAVEAYFGHLSPEEQNTILQALGGLQKIEVDHEKRAQGLSEPKARVALDFVNNYLMGLATGSLFSKKALAAKSGEAAAAHIAMSSVLGAGLVYGMQHAGQYAVWGRAALLGALGQRIGSAIDRWVEQRGTRKAVESRVDYLKKRIFSKGETSFDETSDALIERKRKEATEKDYVLAKDLLRLHAEDPKFPLLQGEIAEIENFVRAFEQHRMEEWRSERAVAESVLADINILSKKDTGTLERELGRKGMKREVISAVIQLASTGAGAAVGVAVPAALMWFLGKKKTEVEEALEANVPGKTSEEEAFEAEPIQAEETEAPPIPPAPETPQGDSHIPVRDERSVAIPREASAPEGMKGGLSQRTAQEVPQSREERVEAEKSDQLEGDTVAREVSRTAVSAKVPETGVPRIETAAPETQFLKNHAVLEAFGYQPKVDSGKLGVSIEFGGKTGPKHLEDAFDGLGGQGLIDKDMETLATSAGGRGKGGAGLTEEMLKGVRNLDTLKAARILNISQNLLAAHEGRAFPEIQAGLKESGFSIEGNKLSIQNYGVFAEKVLKPLVERANTRITPEGAEEGKFGAVAFVDNVKKDTLRMLQEGMLHQTQGTGEVKIPDFNEDPLVTKAEQKLFAGSAAEALKPLKDQGWEIDKMTFSVGAHAESFGAVFLKKGDETLELGLDLRGFNTLGEGTGEVLDAGKILSVNGETLESPVPLDKVTFGAEILEQQNQSIIDTVNEQFKELGPAGTDIQPWDVQQIAKALGVDTNGPLTDGQRLQLTSLLTKHPFLDLYKTGGVYDPEKIHFIAEHPDRTDDSFMKLFQQADTVRRTFGSTVWSKLGLESVEGLIQRGYTFSGQSGGEGRVYLPEKNIDMTFWKRGGDEVHASYVAHGSSASRHYSDPMEVDIGLRIDNPTELLRNPGNLLAKAQQLLSMEKEVKNFLHAIDELRKHPVVLGRDLPKEYINPILQSEYKDVMGSEAGFVKKLVQYGEKMGLPAGRIATPLENIQEALAKEFQGKDFQQLSKSLGQDVVQKATAGQLLAALAQMKATGKIPEELPHHTYYMKPPTFRT